MSPAERSQDLQRTQSEQSSSSTAEDSVDRHCSRYFNLSEKKLLATLELLRSYQIGLQADLNFARLFGIPLGSDQKAEGLGLLFSRHKPQVLETEPEGRTSIHRVDVVRSSTYDPELQSDGNYHVQIAKCKALVELGKSDHDFIATDLPRRLVDPQSYPCDVVSEINTVQSAMARVSPWKAITQQCSWPSMSLRPQSLT